VDDAFDPLDVDELTDDAEILNRVLTHHVVSGTLPSGQLSGGETPTTLEGGSVEIGVSDGTVTVNGIPVTTADIETRNGIVHVIDGVLLERLDVVQRATVTSNLSTLATTVGEAGLAQSLKGDGPFTVFAPTNDALGQYNADALVGENRPQGLLERILQYHVISGQALASGDLPSSGESPQTLEGGTITINVGDGVTLNGRVDVPVTDIEVRNGVVHLLDDVLLRRTNAVQRALVTPNFSILADLVSQAGLEGDLSNEDGTFTVFAPTNDAFLTRFDDNDNGEIDPGEVPSNAADLLKYHVATSVFYAADEPTAPSGAMIPEGDTDVGSLEGSNILVRRDGGSVTLNPGSEASSVITPDVDVTNGVIHGIDRVLQIP
jgi:transforming growth factor-beta-induced protein